MKTKFIFLFIEKKRKMCYQSQICHDLFYSNVCFNTFDCPMRLLDEDCILYDCGHKYNQKTKRGMDVREGRAWCMRTCF